MLNGNHSQAANVYLDYSQKVPPLVREMIRHAAELEVNLKELEAACQASLILCQQCMSRSSSAMVVSAPDALQIVKQSIRPAKSQR